MELQRHNLFRSGIHHDGRLLNARTFRLAALLIVASLGAAAGCSSSSAETTQQSALESPPPAVWSLTIQDLVTNSDRYWVVEAWRERTQNALLEHCVASAGIHGFSTSVTVPDSRAHSLVDIAYRKKWGYNIWNIEQANARSIPQDGRLSEVLLGDGRPQAEVRLPHDYIIGVPTSGCYADARVDMGGDVIRWALVEYLPNDLNEEASSAVAAMDAFRAAARSWSRCMRGKGYETGSPAQMEEAFRKSYPHVPKSIATDADFRTAEIRGAVADAECQMGSGFSRSKARLMAKYAEQLPSEVKQQAKQVIDSLQQASRRLAHKNYRMSMHRPGR